MLTYLTGVAVIPTHGLNLPLHGAEGVAPPFARKITGSPKMERLSA